MPTPRQHMASGVFDDILYVIGGRPTGKSSNVDNKEACHSKTDTWTAKAPMPTARGGIAAATVTINLALWLTKVLKWCGLIPICNKLSIASVAHSYLEKCTKKGIRYDLNKLGKS